MSEVGGVWLFVLRITMSIQSVQREHRDKCKHVGAGRSKDVGLRVHSQ